MLIGQVESRVGKAAGCEVGGLLLVRMWGRRGCLRGSARR